MHFMDLCPPSLSASHTEHEGKRLLNLLKSLERLQKDDKQQHDTKESQDTDHAHILEILCQMATVYQQRGLFKDEESRAKYISNVPVTTAKKRKRGGAAGGGTFGKISTILAQVQDGQNSSSEEAYALSNLCRILIPNNERDIMVYSSSIVEASANAISALCHYCMQNTAVKCAFEKEMIGSIASQLLTGLGKVMRHLLDRTNEDEAITACCNCAKNVMIVSNVKLSRNTNAISSIQSVALELLLRDAGEGSVCISESCRAAASLLSSVPLVGNADNVPPLQIWSDNVLVTARNLENTLVSFLPMVKKIENGKGKRKADDCEWIENVKISIISQTDRMLVFLQRVKGYVSLLIALLEMDGYHISNAGHGATIPINTLLQVSEQMLLFPSIAETRFLATNSKLRDISVEGGLLSPSAAVMIGNAVKHLGFTLLEHICSKLTTTVLPHGNRLLGIAFRHLQSSSSLTLKKLLDPSSSADRNSMKKLLHASILLRMKSVQMYSLIVQKVGSNATCVQNEALPKAIAFIVGNILEQMSYNNNSDDHVIEHQHLGTEGEKAELFGACVDALRTSLLVFGGFLSLQSRTLIDSIISTCLSKLIESNRKFCNVSLVKAAILNLATCAIATPWPDGASSGLIRELQKIAFPLKFDSDIQVSTAAYNAISICNMAITPRATPLVIVSRTTNMDDTTKGAHQSQFFSRESLESGMDTVQEDIIRAKFTERQAVEKKRKEKLMKNELHFKETLKGNTKDIDVLMELNSTKKNANHMEEMSTTEEQEVESPHVSLSHNDETVAKNDLIHDATNEIDNDFVDEENSKAIDLLDKKREDYKNDIHQCHNDEMNVDSSLLDVDSNNDGGDDDFPPIIDCDPDDDDA